MCRTSPGPLGKRDQLQPVSLVALAIGLSALAILIARFGVGLPAGPVCAEALVRDVCRLCRFALALAQLEPASDGFLGSRRALGLLAKLKPPLGRLFGSRRRLPKLANPLQPVCRLVGHRLPRRSRLRDPPAFLHRSARRNSP